MSSSEPNRGNGDERETRPIRDIQSLLRFCITEGVPAAGDEEEVQMDPQRRQWLTEAFKTMTVDLVQEMLQNIQFILQSLETLNRDMLREEDSEEAIEKIIESIDRLMERTEDLDNASDFHKIGGFHILLPLLQSPFSDLKMKGAELTGELVQNHEPCQKAAMEMGLLDTLVKILDSQETVDVVKVKALHAVSCLIRHNQPAQEAFENSLDGYSVILRLMQSTSSESPKLRTKSAFLLSSLLLDRPSAKETLFRMGFVEQLVGLLQFEHDVSHEHLLSALVNFISDFEFGSSECRREEFQFKKLLEDRINFCHNKPEHLEEEGYCKQLLTLCFNDSTLPNPCVWNCEGER